MQSRVPANVKVLSVSELTQAVKTTLEEGFSGVWVTGEVSGARVNPSGHVYLTLKDKSAQLPAVVWRSTAVRLQFELKQGLELIVRGRLSVYQPHGKYQLIIEELHPKGMGALELAFQQLKEKLAALGFFSEHRKKPLPQFPRRVALVTSPTGAALRDMLEVLGRRWPALEIWICPVRVQGEGAALEIAAAISLLNRLHAAGALLIDAMIIGRGGGSLEDLWAFNEECVAHAIFASRIPVVSGVGHETDLTIADLVADLRALTPTQAATLLVRDREELMLQLGDRATRLQTLMDRRVDAIHSRLDELSGRRAFKKPLERLRGAEQRLDEQTERLDRAVRQRLCQSHQRLEAHAARLETLSPLNVLSRGYSLTRKEADQAVVRSPDQVRTGDRLVTTVQHGRIVSRVEEPQVTADPTAS